MTAAPRYRAAPAPLRWLLGIAVVLAAIPTAQAQTPEGGDRGAASPSAKPETPQPTGPDLGALPPLRLAGPARPTPAPTAAPGTAPSILPPLRLSGPASAAPPVHLSTTTTPKPAPPSPPVSPALDATQLPGAPDPMLPPPSSYLSTMWNVWPHAWGYVPALWHAWYHDFTQESRPTTPAERAGTEPTGPTHPDHPEATPTSPVVTSPPTKLTDAELAVLPAPRLIRRKRYNLVISGFGILTATWAADRLLANGLSPRPETWLPLVGPWILLGQQSNVAAPSTQTQALLVVDGLLQAGGLSMALLGFVLTTKQYVVTVAPMRNDPIPREAQ